MSRAVDIWLDRLARRTAARKPDHRHSALGTDPTRRDFLVRTAGVAAALLYPRLLSADPAEAASNNCLGQCGLRESLAISEGEKGCDLAAAEFASELTALKSKFNVFDPVLVREWYRTLCYQGVLVRAGAQKVACEAACLRGATPANIANPTRPPIAPPPPPPPPNCPPGTFFCTSNPAGSDICCASGDQCCPCGACCVVVVDCKCCG